MRHIKLPLTILFTLLIANYSYGQFKEMDKIKQWIEKEKFEKAEKYCIKKTEDLDLEKRKKCFATLGIAQYETYNRKRIRPFMERILEEELFEMALAYTEALADKTTYTAKDFYEMLGKIYLDKDQIEKAYHCIANTDDASLINDMAKKLAEKGKSYYNAQQALDLYKKINKIDYYPELFFHLKEYDSVAKYASGFMCGKYADRLIKKDKKTEAVPLYMKHLRTKNTVNKYDFFNEKGIINLFTSDKNYQSFYNLLNRFYLENPGPLYAPFPRTPQSIVAHTMLDHNESLKTTQNFLANLKLEPHIRNIIIIESLIKLKKTDKAHQFIQQINDAEKPTYNFIGLVLLDKYAETNQKFRDLWKKETGNVSQKSFAEIKKSIYNLSDLSIKQTTYIEYWDFHSLSKTFNSLLSLGKRKSFESYNRYLKKIINNFEKQNAANITISKSIDQKISEDVMPLFKTLLINHETPEDQRKGMILFIRFRMAKSDYYINKSLKTYPGITHHKTVNRKKWAETMDMMAVSYLLNERIKVINRVFSVNKKHLEQLADNLSKLTSEVKICLEKGGVSYESLEKIGKYRDQVYFNYIEAGLEYCEHGILHLKKELEALENKDEDALSESELKYYHYIKSYVPNIAPKTDKYRQHFIYYKKQYEKGLVSDNAPKIYNLGLKVKQHINSVLRPAKLKRFSENPIKNEGTVTDIDGNKYKTVQIGDQIWMAENLKTSRYSNGEKIPYVRKSSDWGKLKSYEKARVEIKKSVTNGINVGALYTYNAATDGIHNTTKQIQGACPDGWHLPTDQEWKELAIIAYYEFPKHSSMVLIDKRYSGIDLYGFAGLLAGYASSTPGNIYQYNKTGFYWTSTATKQKHAIYRSIKPFHGMGRYTERKECGFSVRCVKNKKFKK